jgi:hypothetical protein
MPLPESRLPSGFTCHYVMISQLLALPISFYSAQF